MEKKHVKLAMLNTFECSSVKYCMIIRQQGVFWFTGIHAVVAVDFSNDYTRPRPCSGYALCWVSILMSGRY